MNKKSLVVLAIDSAWRDLRGALESATASELDKPGVYGQWSLKTLLGHIASWDERVCGLLLGSKPWCNDDRDRLNLNDARKTSVLSSGQVLRDLEERHRTLREAMRTANDSLFERDSPIREIIDCNTIYHYLEHGAQIKAWLRTNSPAAPTY